MSLVKFEVIKLPKMYVVGKEIRYSDEALNSDDNRLPGFWNICYEKNMFTALESQTEHVYDNAHVGVFLDWYLGDGDFSYIVGMLMKETAYFPEGYVARELPETDAAHGWVRCKSLHETRAVPFESIAKAINDIGRSCANMKWCIDLYNRTRSTEPDEDGYVILDCYVPLD